MGAFNTVSGLATCPSCGSEGMFEVQFKYGDTWQYEYSLGDCLKWGGNDIGSPGRGRVLVKGVGDVCRHCAVKYPQFDVLIVKDVLTEIRPVRGGRPPGSEGFLVLEP